MEYYTVHKMGLVKKLAEFGFAPDLVELHKTNKGVLVFKYENTAEFKELLTKASEVHKK